MENTEIAVRGYVDSGNIYDNKLEILNFSRTITFDTETTSDQYQNLIFGSYRIDDNHIKIDEGIFYDPRFVGKKLEILNQSAKAIPVRKFVDEIFLPEIFDNQTLCIGFNLPFDLSRLAMDFGYGRSRNRDSFSLKLTIDKKYPRLIVKSIDSTKSFIRFGSNPFSKHQYRGNFIDLRTLSFSLSSEKHTLESACVFFHSPIKKQSIQKHGIITAKYVKYNQNDTDATYHLYLTLTKEYEKYNLRKPITKIFSPASIGKALLDEIGIAPFHEISKISIETLGLLMVTYYGGRTEVKIRKTQVPVRYLDFLSMYPTVCILQNLWDFVIAREIIEEDCTGWTREFVRKISLEDMNDPKIWKELPVIVGIKPDSDILPARSKYGHKHAYNIGINHITSNKTLWYCLADVINSKIQTGKIPNIVKAIRFIPKGIQNTREIKILDEKINPNQDIFKKIIEKRHQLIERKDPQEHNLKIIANSTSYGIYAQINTEKRKSNVDVYGLEYFTTDVDKIERLGERFNPVLSTFITSGSRLILGLVEAILNKNNQTYAFCDTDSMAVPSDMADIIQNYFQKLNPYSFDKSLFKLEKENYENEKLQDLWFYGISSKRYVLYNIVDGKFVIRKHSSHGLGHITNPFSLEMDWEKEFWNDILDYHYKKKSIGDINEKYSKHYAVSQIGISTPNLMARFRKLNKKNSYHEKIKPFNFCLVGFGNGDVKPLCAYKKDSQEAVFDEFIDYTTGKILSGIQYWKDLSQIFWDYLNHPESKFDGDIGILHRKHLQISNVITIGKESNDLEDSEIIGVDNRSYVLYQNQKLDKERILNMSVKEAKQLGIAKNQLYRIKNSIRNDAFNPSKKTLNYFQRYLN